MNSQNRYRNTAAIQASLEKRYARERRFQWYGRIAVAVSFVFLAILLFDIVIKGTPAFTQYYPKVPLQLDLERLGVGSDPAPDELREANYLAVIKSSMREMFPEVEGRREKRQLYALISSAVMSPRVSSRRGTMGQKISASSTSSSRESTRRALTKSKVCSGTNGSYTPTSAPMKETMEA